MIIHELFIPKDVIRLIFVKVHAFDFMAFRSTCKDAKRCLDGIDESKLDYGKMYWHIKKLDYFIKAVRIMDHDFFYMINFWSGNVLVKYFGFIKINCRFTHSNNKLIYELYSDDFYDYNDKTLYYTVDRTNVYVHLKNHFNIKLNSKLSDLILSKIKKNWR